MYEYRCQIVAYSVRRVTAAEDDDDDDDEEAFFRLLSNSLISLVLYTHAALKQFILIYLYSTCVNVSSRPRSLISPAVLAFRNVSRDEDEE